MADFVVKDRGGGYFSSYIRKRIEHKKNFLACITGQTGSGKSYTALRFAETLDPDFDIDQCVFTAKEFMRLVNGEVKELRDGSNIIFDEIQVTMGHLDYFTLQAKLINYILQTFRHRRFVLWVTSPHFSFINASSRKLFHSRLETVGIDYKSKQVSLKPFLIQINQRSGQAYFKYLRVWTAEDGVIPLKKVKAGLPSKDLLNAYEKKKSEFTKRLNKEIMRDLERFEKDKAKPLTDQQRLILDCFVKGMLISAITKEYGIMRQAIYRQMQFIKRKGIKIRPVKDGKDVIRYDIEGYNA